MSYVVIALHYLLVAFIFEYTLKNKFNSWMMVVCAVLANSGFHLGVQEFSIIQAAMLMTFSLLSNLSVVHGSKDRLNFILIVTASGAMGLFFIARPASGKTVLIYVGIVALFAWLHRLLTIKNWSRRILKK